MSRYGGPPPIKVYVGGLDPAAQESEVVDVFSRAGQISKVWIARNPPGFAFIEYQDPRDAEHATRTLDGAEIRGKAVRVEISNKPSKYDRPPERSDRGDRGGDDRGSYRGSSSSSSSTFVTCYICRQPGHIAAVCPSNAPAGSSRPSYPSSSYPPSSGGYPPAPYPPKDYRARSRSPRRHHRHRSGSRSRSRSPKDYHRGGDRRDGREKGRDGDRDRPMEAERGGRDRGDDRRPSSVEGRDRRRDEPYRAGDSRGGDRAGYRAEVDRPRETASDHLPQPPPPQTEERDPNDLGDLDAQA